MFCVLRGSPEPCYLFIFFKPTNLAKCSLVRAGRREWSKG